MAENKRRRLKPNNKILKRMQRKLWLVFGVVCILFVVLIGRVMYIQHTSGDKYEKIVLSQQDYNSTTIPFQRGNIIDARGTVLATSVDVYNVILDCKVLNANEDAITTTITAVTSCFDEIDAETIKTQLANNGTSQYYVLAKKVSYEEMASFEELKASDDYKGKVFGIWFEKEYIRQYPYGSLAAATIGYASGGNVGVIGLENKYSSVLNGVNGRTYGYLNSDSNLETTTIDATNGNNIVLSLDVNIQTIVENAIKEWNDKTMAEYNAANPDAPEAFGSLHTAVLVMNPNNGEIYAMAQYPTFDLNNPRDLSAFYTKEQLAEMSTDDKMDELNKIWQNFCITYTYEPGSTFKPFTVAMGLETGVMTGDETYFCDGGEMISGYPKLVKCVAYRKGGHGTQTIAEALSNSCNDALMQMVRVIGPETFAKYQSIFGFGQKTGIDLTGEASTAGLIYSEKDLNSSINLATNSFGQNFNTTMIQLATGFSSLINGGYLYEPHLVTKITDSNGNTVEEIEPTVLKRTISSETGDLLRSYLEYVVSDGTGKTAGVAGYRIGGKTGTAEKLPRGNHKYLVSFIGFAPVDDPQVVVYVIVDEPGVGAVGDNQAHSSFAQEICHNIFEQILPYLGVESSLSEEEEAEAAAALTEAAQATDSPEAVEADEGGTEDTPEGEESTADPTETPEVEEEQ
ncbi:peptidoglycan D,D-transpeptidase FtsI family protein [Pseudobutyrivibrio sp. MD2005]|uniref:peptidoglycan D,D-transpeptidase FtsI family protein n=1 Tax=Pseudobutyrivibrio sp. MD2005 TaxID=1410616 RepID=UPI0006863FE7|nr:penicillin-binding protein 2 [Pseudobutyrivibrio sp. MD2005]